MLNIKSAMYSAACIRLIKVTVHNSSNALMLKYQPHIPSSFAYKFVCINNKFSTLMKIFSWL